MGRAYRWEPYGVWTTPLARIAAATVRPGNTRQARSGLCNRREIDDGQQQNRGYGYRHAFIEQEHRTTRTKYSRYARFRVKPCVSFCPMYVDLRIVYARRLRYDGYAAGAWITSGQARKNTSTA